MTTTGSADRLPGRLIGWLSVGVATTAFGFSLLAWPLHWWDPLVSRWNWYPTPAPVGLVGLALCLAAALGLATWRDQARVVFSLATLTTLGGYVYYLLSPAEEHFGPAEAVAGGQHPDPWEHPAPSVVIILALAGFAGILGCGRRFQRTFSALTSTLIAVGLVTAVATLYGASFLTLPDGPRLSGIPGIAAFGLGLAIACLRPRIDPIRWIMRLRRGEWLALAVGLLDVLLIPLLYRLLTRGFAGFGVDRAEGFALTVIILILVAQAVIAIEVLVRRDRWGRVADLAIDGMAIVDSAGVVVEANERAGQLLGADRSELLGSRVERWVPPSRRSRHADLRESYSSDTDSDAIEMRYVDAVRLDGTEVPLLITVQPTFIGEESLYVVTLRDVSREQRLDRENRQVRALLAEATDSSLIGQLLVDVKGRVMRANTSFAHLVGSEDSADLVGRSAAELIEPADLAVARDELRPLLRGEQSSGECEVRLRRPDGTETWARVIAKSLPPVDEVRVISAQVIDVTERRTAERLAESALGDLEYRSTHDALTGLPNRSLLLDILARKLARQWGSAQRVSVLYCDIDNFKFVNDEFSHAAGDELLVAMADRLRSQMHDGDALARISGDEFVVVLGDAEAEDAADLGGRILEAVARKPFNLSLGRVHSSLSIGVATSNAESDASSLIREADLALKAAKEEGRSRVRLFDSSLQERADERLLLAQSLGLALANDKIRPWLQPIVRMRDRRVVGFEALARWDSGDELEVPVSEWIEVADEVGLLAPLGERMLVAVLRYLRELPEPIWIAVNLAGSQLNPSVVQSLLSLLDDSGVDPTRLVVEVREKSLTRSPDSALEGIVDLTEAGIRVFFDDFGSGPSSLTTLGRLPVAGIKLDKSFTDTIDDASGPEWRLAKALSELAMSLGLETIATGIEDEVQEAELIAAGWDYGQGWLYGRAAPAEDITVDLQPVVQGVESPEEPTRLSH